MTVPLTDIQEEFRAQLKFLKRSCDEFDAGDTDEFRRIATAIRILVYDHGQSRSVCSQLGLKSLDFKSFSFPINPRNMLTEMPLVAMRTDMEGSIYVPMLDRFPHEMRLMNFDTWWNEEVFRSPRGVSMKRSGFILYTANQAGGAHVDPELDADFHKIARENEAGWIARFGEVDKPMVDLEKAYVRQVGFEVLQTLEPEWNKILGNRICDCGSGLKYRYCHGKKAAR